MISEKFNELTTRAICYLILVVIFSVVASIIITYKVSSFFGLNGNTILLSVVYIIGIFMFAVAIIFIFNLLSSKNRPPIAYQFYNNRDNTQSKSQPVNFSTKSEELKCIYAIEYRERLQNNIDNIQNNSAINILVGLCIAALGVGFIFLYHEDRDYISQIKENIVPYYFFSKFFAVLFIELLAFFFLRLYRQNLHDIKYFQNELSNINAKLIALDFSLKDKKQDKFIYEYVLKQLAKTDRNQILKKGESTIELEKMKFDKNDYQSLIDLMSQFLKTKTDSSSKGDTS